MVYEISGTINDDARIIVIKESDWSIESNTTISGGSYQIVDLESETKWVTARKSDGEVSSYGNVTAIYNPIGDRVVWGGGYNSPTYYNTMDYNSIITPGNATDFGNMSPVVRSLGGTSNGTNDRGLFGGGYTSSHNYTVIIRKITISTTGNTTSFGNLTAAPARAYLNACSNGTNDRGVFGGGDGTGFAGTNVMEYVTISSQSNAQDFGDLTDVSQNNAGLSNATNNRGIFGLGYVTSRTNRIDYFAINSLGDATDFGDMTVAASRRAATSNGVNDRGIFAGGYSNTNVIDYITISSAGNATDFGDLPTTGKTRAGASNGTGNRGLIGGGDSDGVTTNSIDYITISTTGNSSDFGDITVRRNTLAAAENA